MTDGGTSTRGKILDAATAMLREDPAASVSVRGVAARAQVSTGSVRHFFPTQQALLDAVMTAVYEVTLPDEPLRDTSVPARDRLLACMHQMLADVGAGERARTYWHDLVHTFVDRRASEESTATYLALERVGLRRIQDWITTLVREGAIPPGDDRARARFLSSVLTGVALERVLPSDEPRPATETVTLEFAVSAVMGEPPPR